LEHKIRVYDSRELQRQGEYYYITRQRLEELMKKVSEDKSFVSILENQGVEIHFMHGGELVKYCESESRRRLKLYKELLEEKK